MTIAGAMPFSFEKRQSITVQIGDPLQGIAPTQYEAGRATGLDPAQGIEPQSGGTGAGRGLDDRPAG
jgi:hypothetical protein